MKIYAWLSQRITTADYFIQFTPEEMGGLENLFSGVSSKCAEINGQYYGFVDLGRKVFIPLKKPVYVFGGCYIDYPPYGKEELDVTLDLAELSWQEDLDMVLRDQKEKVVRLGRRQFADQN